jgi:hypothetical protein
MYYICTLFIKLSALVHKSSIRAKSVIVIKSIIMNFPFTIPRVTRDVYEPSDALKNPNRKIDASNLDLLTTSVPTFRNLCLNKIAENYASFPFIFQKIQEYDWHYLIEILPTDIDLALTREIQVSAKFEIFDHLIWCI